MDPMPAPTLLESRIASLQGEIVRFLRGRVGPDAEEVAQDVWLKIAKADPECADDAAFRAFAYVVARRCLIDRYRRNRVELVPLDAGPEPHTPDDAESTVAARDIAAVVERTLQTVKPEVAEVFWMRTRDGLAFKAIAERQDCSINTALGRMHGVVKRLKLALAAEGWT